MYHCTFLKEFSQCVPKGFNQIQPTISNVNIAPSYIVAPPYNMYPQGSWLEQTCFYPTWECSTQVTAFLVNWFLRRRFFKIFLYIFRCNNSASHCSPIITTGILIWRNLNQHNLRMLSYKLYLFWPICF